MKRLHYYLPTILYTTGLTYTLLTLYHLGCGVYSRTGDQMDCQLIHWVDTATVCASVHVTNTTLNLILTYLTLSSTNNPIPSHCLTINSYYQPNPSPFYLTTTKHPYLPFTLLCFIAG